SGERPAYRGISRREMLRATAVGVALPFVATASSGLAAEQKGSADDFRKKVEDLLAQARPTDLAGYRFIDIDGADLPWIDLGLTAAKGQQVSFLLTGRMWIARQFDLWFAPGIVFHARTRGRRPMWSPGVDTGTMTAAHDGPLEIARSAAQ